MIEPPDLRSEVDLPEFAPKATAAGRDRLWAFAFDYVLILGYLAILTGIGVFLTVGPVGAEWSELMSDPVRADLVAFLLAVLPVTIYFALGEASDAGATWGKRRVGIRVTGPGGGSPGLARSLARSGLKFLPWQMAHTAMFHIPGFPLAPGEPPPWSPPVLAVAWALVAIYLLGLTRFGGRRTLYDRISGCRVVVGSVSPRAP